MRTACEDNKNPDVVLVLCCFIPKSFVTLKELSKSVFAMFREGTGRALGSTGLLLEESRAVISRVTPALSWRRIIPQEQLRARLLRALSALLVLMLCSHHISSPTELLLERWEHPVGWRPLPCLHTLLFALVTKTGGIGNFLLWNRGINPPSNQRVLHPCYFLFYLREQGRTRGNGLDPESPCWAQCHTQLRTGHLPKDLLHIQGFLTTSSQDQGSPILPSKDQQVICWNLG